MATVIRQQPRDIGAIFGKSIGNFLGNWSYGYKERKDRESAEDADLQKIITRHLLTKNLPSNKTAEIEYDAMEAIKNAKTPEEISVAVEHLRSLKGKRSGQEEIDIAGGKAGAVAAAGLETRGKNLGLIEQLSEAQATGAAVGTVKGKKSMEDVSLGIDKRAAEMKAGVQMKKERKLRDEAWTRDDSIRLAKKAEDEIIRTYGVIKDQATAQKALADVTEKIVSAANEAMDETTFKNAKATILELYKGYKAFGIKPPVLTGGTTKGWNKDLEISFGTGSQSQTNLPAGFVAD